MKNNIYIIKLIDNVDEWSTIETLQFWNDHVDQIDFVLVDSFARLRHIFFALSRIKQRCWESLFIVAKNFFQSIDISTSTSHVKTTFDIFFNSRICLMRKRLSCSRCIFLFIFSTFVVVSIIFSLQIAQDDAFQKHYSRCRARQKRNFVTFIYFFRSSQCCHLFHIETWLTFREFFVDRKNLSMRAIWRSTIDLIEYTRTRFVMWQKQNLMLFHFDVDLERRCWANLLDSSRCDESFSNVSRRSFVTFVVECTLQLDWSRATCISSFVAISKLRLWRSCIRSKCYENVIEKSSKKVFLKFWLSQMLKS